MTQKLVKFLNPKNKGRESSFNSPKDIASQGTVHELATSVPGNLLKMQIPELLNHILWKVGGDAHSSH